MTWLSHESAGVCEVVTCCMCTGAHCHIRRSWYIMTDMTYCYIWRKSFTCVIWLTLWYIMTDMTYCYIWRKSFTCVIWLTLRRHNFVMPVCHIWISHVTLVNEFWLVWHDSFVFVTWWFFDSILSHESRSKLDFKIERKYRTQNSGFVWAKRSFETYILAKHLKKAT